MSRPRAKAARLAVRTLNRQRAVALDRGPIDAALAAAARGLEGELDDAAEVSVVLVSDRRMRELNRRFAGDDHTTDVLSFPLDDGFAPPDAPRELGDIIISVEVAVRQVGTKARRGHRKTASLAEEIALLFVHGALHLLGHDHAASAEAERMLAAEQRVLGRAKGRRGAVS